MPLFVDHGMIKWMKEETTASKHKRPAPSTSSSPPTPSTTSIMEDPSVQQEEAERPSKRQRLIHAEYLIEKKSIKELNLQGDIIQTICSMHHRDGVVHLSEDHLEEILGSLDRARGIIESWRDDIAKQNDGWARYLEGEF
jgi:hypothetical protein